MQVIVDHLKLQVQVICCWHKHLLSPLCVIDRIMC